jgi:hypothetical protein
MVSLSEATLRGTPHHPVAGTLSSCAVRGCDSKAATVRQTPRGWFVGYCERHEQQAARLFDPEPWEEPLA